MRRKQNAQHLDQRLQLLLENAYYQVRRRPLPVARWPGCAPNS